MTKQHESSSRLNAAQRYLDDARAAREAGRLRDAAADARAAIESSLKAAIARHQPVPRTHDPHVVLTNILEDAAAVPAENDATPWDLATPERVGAALSDAERVVAIAMELCAKGDDRRA